MLKLLTKTAPAKPRARRAAKPSKTAGSAPSPRHEHVAVAAYYLAERRGFEPGFELDDWLKAEQILDSGGEG